MNLSDFEADIVVGSLTNWLVYHCQEQLIYQDCNAQSSLWLTERFKKKMQRGIFVDDNIDVRGEWEGCLAITEGQKQLKELLNIARIERIHKQHNLERDNVQQL